MSSTDISNNGMSGKHQIDLITFQSSQPTEFPHTSYCKLGQLTLWMNNIRTEKIHDSNNHLSIRVWHFDICITS